MFAPLLCSGSIPNFVLQNTDRNTAVGKWPKRQFTIWVI